MKRFISLGVCVAALLGVFAAHPAMASTEHLGSTTTTVSGVTVASELLRGLEVIDVGSEGVTLTIAGQDGGGEVVVRYADLVTQSDDGGSSAHSIAPWAALAVVGGGFLRFVRVLTRFGRR
ncbi:MAG: hypothetical protein U1E29_12395 [Coriobacteriia bacterium]|nr:hypothetical protein [Coriobacteriia bacterium]